MSFGGFWATRRMQDTRHHLDAPSLHLLAVLTKLKPRECPRDGFALRVKMSETHIPSFQSPVVLPCFAEP